MGHLIRSRKKIILSHCDRIHPHSLEWCGVCDQTTFTTKLPNAVNAVNVVNAGSLISIGRKGVISGY